MGVVCETMADCTLDVCRCCCRHLHCTLFTLALFHQSLSGICVCRDLPAGEPDNADSSYFGMCAAGLAAYGKHCLSVSCFDHVRTGCVYPEDDGEIRVSKSDHSYAWAEADRERRRPMGDFACFCCFDIFTGY